MFACLSQQCQRLKIAFADSAYARDGLPEWVRTTFGWIVQTVLRPVQAKGFIVLPKRWIVERTFSWLVRYRRHARDYERNTETSEAMIYIAMINIMSRRLARTNLHLKTRSQDLYFANLNNTFLVGANFTDANLTNAALTPYLTQSGAIFHNTIMPDRTITPLALGPGERLVIHQDEIGRVSRSSKHFHFRPLAI